MGNATWPINMITGDTLECDNWLPFLATRTERFTSDKQFKEFLLTQCVVLRQKVVTYHHELMWLFKFIPVPVRVRTEKEGLFFVRKAT